MAIDSATVLVESIVSGAIWRLTQRRHLVPLGARGVPGALGAWTLGPKDPRGQALNVRAYWGSSEQMVDTRGWGGEKRAPLKASHVRRLCIHVCQDARLCQAH